MLAAVKQNGLQSYIRKGVRRQGIGSFWKELLCFDAAPCRHMPVLVHFRGLALNIASEEFRADKDRVSTEVTSDVLLRFLEPSAIITIITITTIISIITIITTTITNYYY